MNRETMTEIRTRGMKEYRNLLIRYPDKLASVFAPNINDAYERLRDNAAYPEKLMSDDTAVKGIVGGLANLVECGILSTTNAGTLMQAIQELHGQELCHILVVTLLISSITAHFGISDGNGGCVISREGAKFFRDMIKKWSGKGFGFWMNRAIDKDLDRLFATHMKDLVERASALLPDMEVRYSAMDSDGVMDRGNELDDELKSILDCPDIAKRYYELYLPVFDERIKTLGDENKHGDMGEADKEVLDGIKEYRRTFEELATLASGYLDGIYPSDDELIKAFYKKMGYDV